MAKQTLNDLARKIEATLPELEQVVANAELLANEDALGAIAQRIFNDGKKQDGTDIGNYADARYIARRKSKGRQTSYVDFQFTGALFNSVQVGQLNGKPAVGIINEEKAVIADNLEERFGIVFKASPQETQEALDKARDFLFEGVKEVIRKWS